MTDETLQRLELVGGASEERGYVEAAEAIRELAAEVRRLRAELAGLREECARICERTHAELDAEYEGGCADTALVAADRIREGSRGGG